MAIASKGFEQGTRVPPAACNHCLRRSSTSHLDFMRSRSRCPTFSGVTRGWNMTNTNVEIECASPQREPGDPSAALTGVMVRVRHELGLYRALGEHGPLT